MKGPKSKMLRMCLPLVMSLSPYGITYSLDSKLTTLDFTQAGTTALRWRVLTLLLFEILFRMLKCPVCSQRLLTRPQSYVDTGKRVLLAGDY